MQRINDQKRIEVFLTGSILSILFSLFNLVAFSIVLFFYSPYILSILFLAGILYFFWIKVFLSYRRALDYRKFNIASMENSATAQLVQGMQEIKLNNAEQLKRWEWENLQKQQFRLSSKNLSLTQIQNLGGFILNEGKNILITFIVAKDVIEGGLTFGSMLAIQYIIGQLSSPIDQLVGFAQQSQDAKISMERLNHIHDMKDEEPQDISLMSTLPEKKDIVLANLSFSYPGSDTPILNDINLTIPEGKVTALVGVSGSGKTTILKLLLKYYDNYTGVIGVGGEDMKFISPKIWRKNCGVVMQDGFIFNDSIVANIAICDEIPDQERLFQACKIANILSFIESLPLKFNTRLGVGGFGISSGQRQRILIARAIYKNPTFIFFDEATNSLDTKNERVIMENLNNFFRGKTVVIIAHRLSTVRQADNIVVLNRGQIIEQGTHAQLTTRKGEYHELIKNQLELN